MPEELSMSSGPRGTQMAEECLAVRVRLLSRRLSRIYDSALRPLGLTVAQLNLLSLIEVVGPAPSGRIADLLAMEISTLSRNARLMQSEGWIRIDPAEHGNGRVLSLTDAGAAKPHEAQPTWEDAQDAARELLGPDGPNDLKRLGDAAWAK
jgi:DNA-binding MarR family transcriptional regulator